MYRAGLEYVLGLRVEGDRLRIAPCIPKNWPGFEVMLRRGATIFDISVSNPEGVSSGIARLFMDGRELAGAAAPLPEDGARHRIEVVLGQPIAADQERTSALP
jgi:cyclic beta-1,2-glucan synthetase